MTRNQMVLVKDWEDYSILPSDQVKLDPANTSGYMLIRTITLDHIFSCMIPWENDKKKINELSITDFETKLQAYFSSQGEELKEVTPQILREIILKDVVAII